MSEQNLSREEAILRAVKKVLTGVVKDTATPAGMLHPLKDETLAAMRECLFLISEREKELAESAGRPMNMRPHFTDEPRRQEAVVIPLDQSGLLRNKPQSKPKE